MKSERNQSGAITPHQPAAISRFGMSKVTAALSAFLLAFVGMTQITHAATSGPLTYFQTSANTIAISSCLTTATGTVVISSTLVIKDSNGVNRSFPITSIGSGAFRNCRNLTRISIPASVTSIGQAAFQDCASLTGVNIPVGVTSINSWTFNRCTDFPSEHPGLDRNGDANRNGISNFLDYASGQDPTAYGLLPLVGVSGNVLTLYQRINGLDARPTAQYSDNLKVWFPLEEGVHYNYSTETATDVTRKIEIHLKADKPESRFFRQTFEP